MKRGCSGILIVMLMVLLCFSPATAMEQRKGAITISPSIGGYQFEGNQTYSEDPFYQPELAAGVGLGYNLTEKWGLEASLHYINANYNENEETDTWLYRLNGLYHFPSIGDKLVPFVAAGLGGITFNRSADDADANFLLNYGAGLKYFFTDNLALRGDVYHIVTLNDNYNNLLYTLGVTYLIGGQKPVAVQPKDSDGDGVIDDMDKCPDTPKGVVVDAAGCPLDSDGDGIYDYLDKCPDVPGPGTVDGCPVKEEVQEEKEEAAAELIEKKRVRLNVEFDFDKADVKAKYHDEIGKVAAVLKANPEITIVVEGHTDSRGTEKYNEALSQKRADSVKKYIVDKFGIKASRIGAKGYGKSRPIADNATEEGRQINRRVEAAIDYEEVIKQ
ncbi:MAG: OmpA family protein [Deltaproteobacteria bacterium]|nr:OmpA family protein [Deltaproteobacteria bacterium]